MHMRVGKDYVDDNAFKTPITKIYLVNQIAFALFA